VLLVYDDTSERPESHLLGEKGVGTDKDVDGPFDESRVQPRPLRRRGAIREERDPQRAIREQRLLARHHQTAEEGGDCRVVLLGQDFGRSHQGALMTAINRRQQGRYRYDRLS
jgi:hypothetical protein